MDLVAPIWEAAKCLCDCTAKHAAFISLLEDNLQSLTDQWTELQNLSQDVKLRVQQAESRPHMGRTRQVDGWLQSVNDLEKTIEDINKRGTKVVQDKCLGKFCHKNCLSSYDLGKEVVKTLDRVKDMKNKGQKFDIDANIAYELPLISLLEDNLQSLTDQWTELRNLSQDVKLRVQQAESRPHMGRTRQVDGWLQSVNDLEKTIEDINKRGTKVVQDKCLGKFCHENCLSSYDLGKEVVKTLDLVKDMKNKGQKFDIDANIAYELPRQPVDKMPVPKTVGMDLMLEKVWDSIKEENVGKIGLYGMGGAGKTTLMKKLNNEFAKRRHDFALVIWIVVSKERNIDKIMEDILEKCKIGGINWKYKSRDDKAREIYNVMEQKKFLLLLDDIWDGLELDSIGVPFPNETNQSKVVFTTRFENVCDQMEAKKFKVKCLTEQEAFDLFCMKVGGETIDSEPSIRGLAQELMRECKGLPLALVTVGRAMAGRRKPQAWKHAIKELQSFPAEVKGMEQKVFFTLKFSYDSLPTAVDKNCFLYFALFPEDYSISVCDLIYLWIGEGLLGVHDSIHEAFNHGEKIVESLMLACLLEDYGDNCVRMHDVIRDTALWLVRDQDRNKNRILVQGEALESSQGDNLDKWKIVERISIMMFGAESGMTWSVPICPNLVTLIVRRSSCINDFANIQFISKLKVLSLEGIMGITTLPVEIGLLIHLEYLELGRVKIEEKFPMEMKNLKMLKVFLLRDVDFSLEIIPLEVISCLERLRVFLFTRDSIWEIRSDLSSSSTIPSTHLEEELFLEQLELLPLLEDLSITLETPSGFNKLFSSTKLQRCVRLVGANYAGIAIDTPLTSSLANMKHLEGIYFAGLQHNLEEFSVNHIDIFCKLSDVYLGDCHAITHLTWLKYAPLLRSLDVSSCNLVEEVITETKDDKDRENMDGIFAYLYRMVLARLPNLRSIYKKALPFPKLDHMAITGCPNLKKLPLDSNSATKFSWIGGEAQWWDNLEWEDPIIKDLFRTKFFEVPP